MRLYLPATLDELQPTLALAPRPAHAVTAALRAALPDEDEEGLEYAAQLAAADDALDLLRAQPAAPRLRAVVALDLPDDRVRPGGDGSATEVMVTGPIAAGSVVCVLVDEPAARDVVAAAVEGRPGALELLDERDLLWYDTGEIARIPR